MFFCKTSFVLAQNTDSLIYIKGYYMSRFFKDEIIFSYEQEVNREKKESYTVVMDYRQFSFFVPTQVGNKIVCKKDMITEKILNYKQNDSIYVIPYKRYNDLLKRINAVTTDVSKETVIFSAAMHLSPYYEISGNDNHLYKCIYVEGYAQHRPIMEIEEKWQNYLWDKFCTVKKTENIEFFFIVKIIYYTPYIVIPEFKKWLPYLE